MLESKLLTELSEHELDSWVIRSAVCSPLWNWLSASLNSHSSYACRRQHDHEYGVHSFFSVCQQYCWHHASVWPPTVKKQRSDPAWPFLTVTRSAFLVCCNNVLEMQTVLAQFPLTEACFTCVCFRCTETEAVSPPLCLSLLIPEDISAHYKMLEAFKSRCLAEGCNKPLLKISPFSSQFVKTWCVQDYSLYLLRSGWCIKIIYEMQETQRALPGLTTALLLHMIGSLQWEM